MTRGRLFSPGPKTDTSPKRNSESCYQFYDRSGRPEVVEIRRVLKSWFEQFSLPSQNQVREFLGRFRNFDDRQFLGAFWELYLASVLRAANMTVERRDVAGRSPDFLVSGASVEFFLEATIASHTDREVAAHRRLGDLVDALQDLDASRFRFILDVSSYGNEQPGTTAILREIESWAAGLDADEIRRSLPNERRWRHLPALPLSNADWRILVRALPKDHGEGGGSPRRALLSSPGPPIHRIRSAEKFRRSIEGKAGHYGTLSKPLIVAVMVDELSGIDHWDIKTALFGVVSGERSVLDRAAERLQAGAWVDSRGQPKNTRVQAVIVVGGLNPWGLCSTTPALIANPWGGLQEDSMAALPWPQWGLQEEGWSVTRDQQPIHQLLGLWPDWPAKVGPK